MKNMEEKIILTLKKIKGDDCDEREDLIYGGYVDSFELLAFIEQLEERFNIHIPLERINPDDFDSIDSISNIINEISNGHE